MDEPLTPPPSFRVLRIRTRTRTRTFSDENKCDHIAPVRSTEGFVVPTRGLKESSPARGRTRSRNVRNGLTLNTNCVRPHLSLGLPALCSPPPSRGDSISVGGDDDLIFQMSPIQSHSPSLACFDGIHQVHADANRVKQSTMQTLSALWEKHKTSLTTAASQIHPPRTPNKRMRSDTLTQHQRGFSDSHANVFPPRDRSNGHRPHQSAKAVLDLSPMLHAPPEPLSPLPSEEPFLYSFPSFDSSPLVKARQARARRQAGKASTDEEFLTGSLESESVGGEEDTSLKVKVENPAPQRFGPIRARKLRIQSGESLSNEVDDTNCISHAFKSSSLDSEKETVLDDGDSFDTSYFSSQRSSSVSSSSTTDAASLAHSNVFSSSLLASFPVQPSSRSRTHSSSCSRERIRRSQPSEISPEAQAKAMMNRGRTSRRASAEAQHPRAEYSGGDRRERGRTPPRGRRPSEDTRTATAAARTIVR